MFLRNWPKILNITLSYMHTQFGLMVGGWGGGAGLEIMGNIYPLYCPSVLLPIRSTAHPTYCNIRPTTAVYFLYYLRVRLG